MARIATALLLLVAMPAAVTAQATGSYTYHVDPVTAFPGETIEVPVRLDVDGPPVAGWSYSLSHDQAQLDLLSATIGSTTATVNGGSPADFYTTELLPAGYSVGTVVSLAGSATLAAGVNYELDVLTYEVVGVQTSDTLLEFCSCIGSPPVSEVVVVAGSPVMHTQVDGVVSIVAGVLFIRGDANGDGTFDISDAIATLSQLFVTGAPATGCDDAADANDDGAIDIAGAVSTLTALFVSGSAPPPDPHPGCGEDPTVDGLECDSGCP